MTTITTDKSVSIILVTFNAWELTRRCLLTLLKEPYSHCMEIILVDNGSADGTAVRARTEFPNITVLDAGGNTGFGQACNLGVATAKGEFIVLLNNDAQLAATQLQQLLDTYQRLQLNGIYTARIVDEDGAEETSCFRTISPNKLLASAFQRLDRATQGSAYALSEIDSEALEIDWCSGAFMLFPRMIWDHCGGFDEQFFMYYEDVDLCLRWRANGYKCYVNTRICVLHTCGGSATDPIARAKTVDRSQRYFYGKHYGKTGAARARLFQVLRSAMRCILHGTLAVNPQQREACTLHYHLLIAALGRD